MSKRNFLGVSSLLLSLSFFSGFAAAHAHLTAQQPQANAQLTASPDVLAFTFSEAIEPSFSGVVVTDAQNQQVLKAQALSSKEKGDNNNQMKVVLNKSLPAGQYQVAWHVLSVDGHKTKGTSSFSIK